MATVERCAVKAMNDERTISLDELHRQVTEHAGDRQVRIVAVSKRQPVAAIRKLAAAGQQDFAENYVQEAEPKIAELADQPLCWHFIGPLQSNKTRAVAARFDWVQSVDRAKIARRLSDQRPADATPLQVLVQVKLGDEATKSGCSERDVPALAEEIEQLPRLRLRGLMAIPPQEYSLDAQRRHFTRLRGLFEVLQDAAHEVDTLSMGMSGDYRVALEEGATMIRIGTALFGPRGENRS